MPCAIHKELNVIWSEAAQEFSSAVAALSGPQIGTMSKPKYAALVAKAEAARLASENARIAIQLHSKEHGC
jgi:hypothetical protein